RLVIEAALVPEAVSINRAKSSLVLVEELIEEGWLDGEPIHEELIYQRARMALAEGDVERAKELADSIKGGDSAFAQAAERLFVGDAVRRFDSLWQVEAHRGSYTPEIVRVAREVVQSGGAALGSIGDTEASEIDKQTQALIVAVLMASAVLWEGDQDRSVVKEGRAFSAIALTLAPKEPRVLRSAAVLARADNDSEQSLTLWRTLATGLDAETMAWYEARFYQLDVLSNVDAGRAAQALRGHVVFYGPTMGPDPWGNRFLLLMRKLDVDISGEEEDND
ncbi:MAG: hypothetical protein AAGB34_04810, partial [Planctomycetota bacterium]